MDKQKLDKWAELLLDTGKGNNLINFKNTKSTTVEVLYPFSDELFTKAINNGTYEVYDPKIEEKQDEDELNETASENKEAKVVTVDNSNKSDLTPKDAYLNEYRQRLKKNQLLVYSLNKNPIPAVRYIDKKAKEYIEETGVTVAHIAFGFVNWKESDYSEYEYHAPILLVPIQLGRESAIAPYVIQCSGDEVIVNPTFTFKMQAEYGALLPEYDGGGLEEYLSLVRSSVEKLGWTVSNEAKIGIFSFLKINMYKDLKENADIILQNQNVRMLLGESPIDNHIDGATEAEPDANPLIQLNNVVDADSSQIEAIEMAKAGKSFVLQGPPGTGKSQTITNIIAELLANGKKVLFVSEKLAALNVVYDKLKMAGLEEFCLALHSHRANKKTVINDLCTTLREPKKALARSKAFNDLRSKALAQQQLDKYVYEVHRQRDNLGKSFYQIFEEYSSYRDVPVINWSVKDIRSKDYNYYDDASDLIGQYVGFIPSIGYNYKTNCWYGLSVKDASYETTKKVENILRDTSDYFKRIYPAVMDANEYYETKCLSLNDAKLWGDFFDVLSKSRYLSSKIFNVENYEFTLGALLQLAEHGDAINEDRKKLEKYNDEIEDLKAGQYSILLNNYQSIFSRLFKSEYKEIIKDIRSRRIDGGKVSYDEAIFVCSTVEGLQKHLEEFHKVEACVVECLGEAYKSFDTDWEELTIEVKALQTILEGNQDLGAIKNYDFVRIEEEKDNFASYAKEFQSKLSRGSECLQSITEIFENDVYSFETTPIDIVINKCEECLAGIDSMNNWVQFNSLFAKLKEKNLDSFIDEVIKAKLDESTFVSSFRKRCLFQWLDDIVVKTPELAGFNAVNHNMTIETFKTADKLHFDINKAKIHSALSNNRPSLEYVVPGSPAQILLREGEKKRKQKTIRNLMIEIGDFIQSLKPCFLMSPLSVSTFLDAKAIKFDTVVFDEASQIFPQDAIGSIYRGNQLIVVGDSKQMPPSNFFNATIDSDEYDDQAEDVTDFESILDICSTVLPQLSLQWHYRSKFEELIAFSNRNYYRNDLITFPSAEKKHTDIGVDYYYVDGIFDRRSHTNRREAEKVVNLIYQHIKDHPDRSLGVVAFSIKQQDLIDRLLNEKRQKMPSFEPFFKENKAEPFFIKNLETVQGDERDTIIFSTAYGKDSMGRLYHNFGPLNRAGGERRLNVAVTRAKYNVKLVSSMHYTDIDLKKTSAEGARLLREYLDYAENGDIALERSLSINPYEEFDSGFEQEVYEYLVSNGYKVDTQVGCSGYKIDLAVKKPDSSDYFIAIECDGATYHSSRNARDRDRLRQEVLENMGWKFYRIWSTDWFRNKNVAKRRLLDAVNEAQNNKPVKVQKLSEPEDTKKAASYEIEAKPSENIFKPYMQADIEELMDEFGYSYDDYKKMVVKILEVEAPLLEESLIRRTVRWFDREKYTSYVDEEYNYAMRRYSDYGIIKRNGFLYLKDKLIEFRYDNGIHRDLNQISPRELAAGMVGIIKQAKSVSKEGLFKTMSELCGLKRLTAEGTKYMEAALEVISNYVNMGNDGFITLKVKNDS